MHGSSTPEHHARIIGTSRFGQPIAIYKNRTYELMPLDADVSVSTAPDQQTPVDDQYEPSLAQEEH